VVLSEFTVGDADVIDGIVNFKDEDGFAVSFSKTYVYETAINPPLIGTGDIGFGEFRIESVSNDKAKTIPKTFDTAIAKEKFKGSCLERQMGYHASRNGKSSDTASLYNYGNIWYKQAYKTYLEIASLGVLGYSNLTDKHIGHDLMRLLPKVENQDPNISSVASSGYCDSLAEHIVRGPSAPSEGRGTLFRLFESQNHHSGTTSSDYKVFWLSKDRLEHILLNHGENSNRVSNEYVPKSRFSNASQIVPMIESSILNSQSNNRGLDRNFGHLDIPSFQTKFLGNNWYSYNQSNQANLLDRTDVMMIFISDKDPTKTRIQTAFPLVPSAYLEYGIQGGPRP
jgi:hypothetical protein